MEHMGGINKLYVIPLSTSYSIDNRIQSYSALHPNQKSYRNLFPRCWLPYLVQKTLLTVKYVFKEEKATRSLSPYIRLIWPASSYFGPAFHANNLSANLTALPVLPTFVLRNLVGMQHFFPTLARPIFSPSVKHFPHSYADKEAWCL